MYKNKIHKIINKFMQYLSFKREVIRFIFLSSLLTFSSTVSYKTYSTYNSNPLFKNPETVLQVIINEPTIHSLLIGLIIIAAGILCYSLIVSKGIKGFKFGVAEVKLNNQEKKEIKASNQTKFISTIIHNYPKTLEDLLSKDELNVEGMLSYLINDYEKFVKITKDDRKMVEHQVTTSIEDLTSIEKKMMKSIQNDDIESTTYHNRILGKQNHLVGILNRDNQEYFVTIQSHPDYEFDDYDKEAIESIIGITNMMMDTMDMIDIFND